MALVDYFLKIDGIPGESTDKTHKDEIEIDSFSWGVSQTATRPGAGGGAGKVQMQDFQFVMRVNKASPNLFLKCATGQHLKTAVLTARKAGGDKGQAQEFLKINFSDLLVSGYREGGDSEAARDSASLRAAKATATTGEPQTIVVLPPPGGSGSLVFDPRKTPPVQVVPGEGNVLVAGVLNGLRARAIAEFDYRILIGLLTAPFTTATLRLQVDQVRNASPTPTDVVNLASVVSPTSGGTAQGPSPHMQATFGVFFYQPADLQITADDFRRHARLLGKITIDASDPNAPLGNLDVDLTKLVTRSSEGTPPPGTGGIRIQLLSVHLLDDGTNNDDKHDDGEEHDDHESRNDQQQQADRRGRQGEDEEDDDHDDAKVRDVVASFVASLVFDTA